MKVDPNASVELPDQIFEGQNPGGIGAQFGLISYKLAHFG
jgi:hypothetical protein